MLDSQAFDACEYKVLGLCKKPPLVYPTNLSYFIFLSVRTWCSVRLDCTPLWLPRVCRTSNSVLLHSRLYNNKSLLMNPTLPSFLRLKYKNLIGSLDINIRHKIHALRYITFLCICKKLWQFSSCYNNIDCTIDCNNYFILYLNT